METYIKNFKHKIGMNCLTTSLRDIVQFNGYDMDEDLCMGLSGSFSFWYSRCPKFMQATGVGNNIYDEFAAITKVQHYYTQFEDNDTAWKIACEYIKHSIPVLLDVEMASYVEHLSNSDMEKRKIVDFKNTLNFRVGGHVTCMTGYDDDNVWLYENLKSQQMAVPIQVIKQARNPVDIEFVPPRNGMHVFYFPEKLPDLDYMLDLAIVRAINNMEITYNKPNYCYGGITYDCSGLKGIEKMFADITSVYEVRNEEGLGQLNALIQILNRWGGNEVNRAAYSRFLRNVANQRNSKELMMASQAYIEASKLWKLFLKNLGMRSIESTLEYDGFVEDSKSVIMAKEKEALEYLHIAMKY